MSPDKSLLKIDPSNLDKECESLPQTAFVWGEKVAEARKRVKELTQEVKVKAADLDADIRANPESHGLLKVTDDGVKSAIVRAGSYQVIVTKLHEAEYHLEVLEAFFWALKDKKSMIEVMAQLHGQMYWSRPNTTQADEQYREGVAREVNNGVEERKKRTTTTVRGTKTRKG